MDYQHSGASWQAVDRETVRSLLQIAIDSGVVLTEEMALADYHYWINRGDMKPVRYYAARWGWKRWKVQSFIEKSSGHGPDKFRTDSGQDPSISDELPQQNGHTRTSSGHASDSIEDTDRKISDRRKKHTCSPELKSQVEALYDAYPKKVAKPKAIEAIRKALGQAPFEAILAGVRRYAESTEATDRQYIAHPATWFNAGRWDDEPEPSTSHKHGASNGQPQKPTSSYERRMQTTVPEFLESLERQREYKPEPFFKPMPTEPPTPDSGGLRLVSGRPTGSDKG